MYRSNFYYSLLEQKLAKGTYGLHLSLLNLSGMTTRSHEANVSFRTRVGTIDINYTTEA